MMRKFSYSREKSAKGRLILSHHIVSPVVSLSLHFFGHVIVGKVPGQLHIEPVYIFSLKILKSKGSTLLRQ